MKYHSTEYPVSWFRDRQVEGNLVLQKPFLQRRLVWKLRQKSHLIESILMGYPIPEIYVQLRTTAAGESSFTVVDGQQRISAILAFLGLKEDDEDNGFELAHLDADSGWRNLSWNDMTEEQKAGFFGHLLTARILDDFSDEQTRDLFRRLNKYLTKLSDQEIRNATYSGPLIRLAQTVADDSFWAENGIVSAEDIRRMRDIEFMSELIIGLIHGPQGGSTKAIDDFYAEYEEYGEEFPSQALVRKRFGRTLEIIQELFPAIKASRWRNKTDFYTLFVALAHLLQDHRLAEAKFKRLRKSLDEFAEGVAIRLADEKAAVSDTVVEYVRAVEKGVSDKTRRANRHRALLEVVSPYFTKRRGS